VPLKALPWKPGDRIPRGRGALEVVEVGDEADRTSLVVRKTPGPVTRGA
jgi:hypothetical protein